jgi:hypothetical protein
MSGQQTIWRRLYADVLVMGKQILDKRDQPELVEDFDWRERYELD